MKRTALVIRGINEGGGVARFVKNLLGNLNFSNRKYTLVVDSGFDTSSYSNLQVKVIAAPNKLIWDMYKSVQYLRSEKFDEIYYFKNIIPITHFLVPGKKNIIVHDLAYYHKSFQVYPLLDTIYMRCQFPFSIRHSNRIYSVSHYTKADILSRFSQARDRVVVCSEALEGEFVDVGKCKNQWRYDFKKRGYIFYAGSFNPRKNIPRFIRVFEKLRGRGLNVELVMTGSRGIGARKVWTAIERSSAKRHIHVLGKVSDHELKELYTFAQVFVYPSLFEGFGLPILEAMALGCPVVCSQATSCPEVGGDAAIYFDPNSIEDMCKKIEIVVNDTALQETQIKKGYKNLKRFSWERVNSIIFS